jgi:TolB protein
MVLAATVLASGSGCSFIQSLFSPKPLPRPRPVVQQIPIQAAPDPVTASSPAGIDHFGVLPEHDDVPFVGRAAGAFQQHTFTHVGVDIDPDIDASGQWLVFASTRHAARPDLYMKSVTGRAVTQLTSDPAGDVQPAFSPDGTRVAFASDRAGSWDIWALEIIAGRPVQITRDAGHEVHPSWSPDGRFLVYSAVPERGGEWELWIVDLSRPATKKSIGSGLFPRWSPTGEAIAFQRARRRDSQLFSIWTVMLIDGEPLRPTEIVSAPDHALITPAWSPDGRRLAYCAVTGPRERPESQDHRPSDIWLVEIDGSNPIRLTEGDGYHYTPTWSRDGRVYFPRVRDGQESIWSVRPVTSGRLAGIPPAGQSVRPAAQVLPADNRPRPAFAPQPAPMSAAPLPDTGSTPSSSTASMGGS